MNLESKTVLKNRVSDLDKLIADEKERIAPIKQKRDEYNEKIAESDKVIDTLKKERENIKQDVDKSAALNP